MNTVNTASQLRLAADIIETGHPWKSHPQAPDTDIYEALREEWEIRIVLATPPDGRELHNHDSLTAEQVGVGYRLTLKGEPTNLHTEQQEYWVGDKWEASGEVFSDTFDEAQNARCTYRLPLSVPWPADPYAELKAAQAAGKVIQFNPGDSLGWRDHPIGDFTVGPEHYRIKPDAPQVTEEQRKQGYEQYGFGPGITIADPCIKSDAPPFKLGLEDFIKNIKELLATLERQVQP